MILCCTKRMMLETELKHTSNMNWLQLPSGDQEPLSQWVIILTHLPRGSGPDFWKFILGKLCMIRLTCREGTFLDSINNWLQLSDFWHKLKSSALRRWSTRLRLTVWWQDNPCLSTPLMWWVPQLTGWFVIDWLVELCWRDNSCP